MPSYANISLSLISQYDALAIPEYKPPATDLDDPFDSCPSSLISPTRPLISVYIPTYPGSTFWIQYVVSPPHSPKSLYYFKLFLNGAHIVSWGCGEKDGYEGRTMFGLFHDPNGKYERRMLGFGLETRESKMRENNFLEVRVYRAKGRRRRPFTITGKEDLEEHESGPIRFGSSDREMRAEGAEMK
jgi:hypothetical protein